MHRHIRLTIGLAALLGTAACGNQRTAAVDDSLSRDLEAAGASSLELRPTQQGAVVVSDVEQVAQPRAAAPAAPAARRAIQRQTPKRTPQRQVLAVKREATEELSAPEPTVQDDAPVATRPSNVASPVMSPAPRGGYRSVGEVIRNAPFPINP